MSAVVSVSAGSCATTTERLEGLCLIQSFGRLSFRTLRFRPLIVDSAVVTAVNTRMVGRENFVRAGESVALSARGRKGFIRAYAQRMDTLVTHPIFGYRVAYRRVLEIQTRLLGRVVSGQLSRYPGFETR